MKRVTFWICLCACVSSACVERSAAPCTTTQSGDGTVTLQCGDDDPVTLVGAPGEAGASGRDGRDAAVRTEQASEDQCAAGGEVFFVGLDLDSNGELDAGEETQNFILCQVEGERGASALIEVAQADMNKCPSGGQLLEMGLDADMSGELEPPEVMQSFTLCNGTSGSGQDGANSVIQVKVGEGTCAGGGDLVEVGVDVDRDGVLSSAEITSSFDVCDGRDGADGSGALIDVTEEPPGMNCREGGQRIEVGQDANQNGALDPGEVNASQTSYICHPEPIEFAEVSAGYFHTCAVTTRGAAMCWGYGARGRLGNGSSDDALTPTVVTGLESGVASVAVGSSHACAVTVSGGVKCWGSGSLGQLGNGDTSYQDTPVDVIGLSSGVASLSAGNGHTCALMTGGAVKCWGSAFNGQLGDGSNTSSSTPVDVVGLSGVASLSAGGSHTCVVTTGGAAKCWGAGGSGRLGNGSSSDSSSPVDVVGLSSGVASLSAGGKHTCAVTTSGAAKCWGLGSNGVLGNGSSSGIHNTPDDVAGLGSGVSSIVAGARHTCAIVSNGAVKCWGSGENGQLGDGNYAGSNAPVDVVGMGRGGVSVTCGELHTCATTQNGGAKCWGFGSSGLLGDGIIGRSNTPVDVLAD